MLKFFFLLGVALQPFQAMGLGNMYKDFSIKVNWDDALSICRQLGSHLMTITSDASPNPLKEGVNPIKARGCPEGFTYYHLKKKCYKAFPDTVKWDEAQKKCINERSHLVTITSADSLVPLKNVVDPIKDPCMNLDFNSLTFWTAGKRMLSKDKFVWVPYIGAMKEMQYTNWCPGEPNNIEGKEDCVHFEAGDNNLFWYDSNCEMPKCFVCEVDL